MKSIARLMIVVVILVAGAFGGWLVSAFLPPSPAGMLVAGGQGGGGGPGGGGMGAGGGMPPTPVLVSGADERRFVERVRSVGTARAIDSVTILPRVAGELVTVNVEAGDTVSAGDVLFEVESTEQEARLAEARARADDARGRYERNRAASGSVPQAQIEQYAAELAVAEAQVASAEFALRNTRITAPFDGTVGLIGPSSGAMVGPDTLLTTLDDRTRTKVTFSVPERFIGGLSEGTELTARSSAYAETTFEGTVSALGGRVDEQTRTLTVEATLENPENLLRPGMFLTIDLALTPETHIAVPEDGLVVQGGDAFVFSVDGENVAHQIAVDIIQRADGWVAVRGDVAADASIIVAGQTRARDGGQVMLIDADSEDDGAGGGPAGPQVSEAR
ncbi:efflux RND transporter periplasmic adaptor subunit [Fodinicurvata sp. EGI_FJ10296]|uniref:efflux RND transporter periplasmic adaptor subunit n=1 Tax=Fodinicurvata sp. EGI_FJ10296 TaxID=3231908 RepID=UPI0034573762